MHVHINDLEVFLVTAFRKKVRPLSIAFPRFNFRIVIKIPKLNSLDARAAACSFCDGRVNELAPHIHADPQSTQGLSVLALSEEQARQVRSGKIEIADLVIDLIFTHEG